MKIALFKKQLNKKMIPLKNSLNLCKNMKKFWMMKKLKILKTHLMVKEEVTMKKNKKKKKSQSNKMKLKPKQKKKKEEEEQQQH